MSSIIIHQGSPITRERKARALLEDHQLHEITPVKGKIGIGAVRDMLPHLHIKPLENGRKGLLILEAQAMNLEAQNCLLKTLEEPPAFLTLILTVPNAKLLLPTVISRCLIRPAEAGEKAGTDRLIGQILGTNYGQRLQIFEQNFGYSLEEALRFLDSAEQHLKENLSRTGDTRIFNHLWETKRLLRNPSANVKLVVDELLLSW